MWSPWSLARGIVSDKSVWLLDLGPWILALASDWSRRDCLGLLTCHCSWAASLSRVQLPSGPFWPLGLLMLGLGIYALDNMLVTRSFVPNSPAHILRRASVEFIK